MVARTIAVGHRPRDLALVQVDRNELTVRRLEEREPLWTGRRLKRPHHPADIRARMGGFDEADQRRPLDRRDVQHPGFRVDARAAPVGAPHQARHLDSPLRSVRLFVNDRRWREERPVDVLAKDVERLLPELGREVDDVVDRHSLLVERRRLGREGLRRRVRLARHVAARYRPLLDRPYRLTGDTVEDVRERLLADDRDRLDLATVNPDVYEVGSRRKVIIPQPVMNRLEVPDALAGLRVETHEALREEIVAVPVAAP